MRRLPTRASVLGLVVATGLGASPFSPVPAGSFVYDFANELIAAGLIPGYSTPLDAGERVSRMQMAGFVSKLLGAASAKLAGKELPEGQKNRLEALRAEFSGELAILAQPGHDAWTAALAPPKATPRPAEVSLDEKAGLVIKSKSAPGLVDQRLRLQLRTQLMYASDDFPAYSAPGGSPRQDVSGFSVRRAQVIADQTLHPKLEARFMYDVGRNQGILMDAALKWTLDPSFKLWFGQFQHPFARESLGGIGDQIFVDWGLANLVFGFNGLTTAQPAGLGALLGHGMGRPAQLQLWGDLGDPKRHGNLRYFLNVGNGRGENERNENEGLLYSAKLEFHPWGDPGYAPGGMTNPRDPKLALDLGVFVDEKLRSFDLDGSGAVTASDQHDRQGMVLGYSLKHRRFATQGESFRQWITPEAPGLPRRGSNGWYAQVSWMWEPARWEAALRWNGVDPDRSRMGNSQFERTLALNHYLNGHRHKISADLSELEDDLRPQNDDRRFRLQYQLAF